MLKLLCACVQFLSEIETKSISILFLGTTIYLFWLGQINCTLHHLNNWVPETLWDLARCIKCDQLMISYCPWASSWAVGRRRRPPARPWRCPCAPSAPPSLCGRWSCSFHPNPSPEMQLGTNFTDAHKLLTTLLHFFSCFLFVHWTEVDVFSSRRWDPIRSQMQQRLCGFTTKTVSVNRNTQVHSFCQLCKVVHLILMHVFKVHFTSIYTWRKRHPKTHLCTSNSCHYPQQLCMAIFSPPTIMTSHVPVNHRQADGSFITVKRQRDNQ